MLSWRRTEYCFRIRCPFGLNREFSTPLFGKAETVPPLYEGARSKQCHWIYSGKAWAKPWTRVRRTAWLTITVRNRKIAVPASDGKGIRHKHFPMLWLCVYSPLFHSEKGFFVLSFFIVYLQQVYGNHCSFPNWFYWFYCIILSGVSLIGTLYFFEKTPQKACCDFNFKSFSS